MAEGIDFNGPLGWAFFIFAMLVFLVTRWWFWAIVLTVCGVWYLIRRMRRES